MKKDKDKDKENHEGDVSYTTPTKRKGEKIQQKEGRSIDIESNNQEEEDISIDLPSVCCIFSLLRLVVVV